MFYEEKVINGELFCRSTPNGLWRVATAGHAHAVNELLRLTYAQRLEAMRYFCGQCGRHQSEIHGCPCQETSQ